VPPVPCYHHPAGGVTESAAMVSNVRVSARPEKFEMCIRDRAIGNSMPNGAGVEAVRRIVYFGSYNTAGNLLVIAIYTVAGIAIAVTGASVLARRAAAGQSEVAAVI